MEIWPNEVCDREKIGTMGIRTRTVNGPLIDQTLNSD